MKRQVLSLSSALLASFIPFAVQGQEAAPEDAGLAALEARYASDRTADLRAGLARYADELTLLQKSLLAGNDNAGAARVQLELDRVLPVLGPVNAVGGGDEFSIFEDQGSAATLPANTATPADLESLLRALQPAAAPAGTLPGKPDSSASKPTGKGAKRLLKMAGAQLEGTYNPDYGYSYWYGQGRKATWTVSDLPAGSCRLVLRYSCDDKTGGGRLMAKVGGTKIEVEVLSTGGWKRRRDLTIGPFPLTDSRADLKLEVVSIRPGASSLFDLQAVLLIPEDSPRTP